jgi:hypothetical protein
MADTIPLQEVSDIFANKPLEDLIDELEAAFPDQWPRVAVDPYNQGYRAGAIEVIRRVKQLRRNSDE